VRLGQAHIAHVPWLLSILWAFTRGTAWLPAVRTRLTDLRMICAVIRRGWVSVAYDGARPVGFIVREGSRIHALYVHPKARGRGFGHALLQEAKAEARHLDLYVIQQNRGAWAFYAREGFAEAGRGAGLGNDENLPDIRMIWHAREAL
jgi:ribosomal protein S18 acetylase RimI-like enzyme